MDFGLDTSGLVAELVLTGCCLAAAIIIKIPAQAKGGLPDPGLIGEAMVRYLLITNLYNEEANVGGLFDSMESQTLPPALWLIIDDGSTDGTHGLLLKRSDSTRLRVQVWTGPTKTKPDYDTIGLSIKMALGSLDPEIYKSFGYYCVLDADSRVAPAYFEELLGRMEKDPKLGMASGVVWTKDGAERTRSDLARGSGRATRAEIWLSVPIEDLPNVASDAFFNAKTKMMGFSSAMFDDLRVVEQRPTSQVTPAGRYRRGRLMAMFWYNPVVVLAHVISILCHARNPLPLIRGYLHGLKGQRIQDPSIRAYFGRRMMLDWLKEKLSRRRVWGK